MSTIVGLIRQFFQLFVWWVVCTPWEQIVRVRAGKHVKLLEAGIHFRVPYLDRVYRQTTRLRTMALPVQTLTTLDGKTLTCAGSVGYAIGDMVRLYQTLHDAEDTLRQRTMGAIANYVYTHLAAECTPAAVQADAGSKINLSQYGLTEATVQLTAFCFVRTHRLIMDSMWGSASNLNTITHEDSPA